MVLRRFGWVLVLAGLLGAWQAFVRLRGIPEYLLPAPSAIARTLVDERGRLASDGLVTLREMLVGYGAAVIGGLAAAIGLHLSPTARRAMYPLLVASQSVPVVAIAPVLVIYLGFGLTSKVVIVALVCFFPVTVNALDGFASVDHEYRRMMRTLHADGWAIFRRVEFPGALPGVFSGMRVAASYAAVAALFAEYAGGSSGLAVPMRDPLDTPLVGAAVVVLAAMALALFGIVTLAERVIAPWARRVD
ncbi:MAG: ABC transporter permease [Gaiellales bacterium]